LILQKEIREKAQTWKVPPETVDKDYVLGHFLSLFSEKFNDQLVFKGGTCLRKCYFPDYRFSEDLDFTALKNDFELNQKDLVEIKKQIERFVGIRLDVGKIKLLKHQNEPKGYQVKIKYWGANHSINDTPPSPNRWMTNIKLEISTDEKIVTKAVGKKIIHRYSDKLQFAMVKAYSLDEVIAEKLRALKQRAYTAPRDIYDLFMLTNDFKLNDWERIKPLFDQKMRTKNLNIESAEELVSNENLQHISKAWDSSISHQLVKNQIPQKDKIIETVVQKIKQYL
jgi:predicted nucleotidyltransferase component of viral defense system